MLEVVSVMCNAMLAMKQKLQAVPGVQHKLALLRNEAARRLEVPYYKTGRQQRQSRYRVKKRAIQKQKAEMQQASAAASEVSICSGSEDSNIPLRGSLWTKAPTLSATVAALEKLKKMAEEAFGLRLE